MSNENPTPPAPVDVKALMAKWEAQTQRAAELHPANKASLFAALAAAGVTRVDVRFDGVGDSGQIEEVQALAGDDPVELPATTVEIKRLHDRQEAPEIVVEFVDDPDPLTPMGLKGLGEPPIVPTAAAVANAVAAATGLRLREAPLTRRRFLEARSEVPA